MKYSNNKQKFVFLDIDGVCNSKDTRIVPAIGYGFSSFDGIDKNCIKKLNFIAKVTGCLFVISSSWKVNYKIKEIISHLRSYGFEGKFYGSTPYNWSCNHGVEIKNWIKKHFCEIESFVILDDCEDVYDCFSNKRIVLTSDDFGLTDHDMQLALQILQIPLSKEEINE